MPINRPSRLSRVTRTRSSSIFRSSCKTAERVTEEVFTMNLQFWLRCLAIHIVIDASALTLAQQSDEEGSRGKFITTRPKAPRVKPVSKGTSSTSQTTTEQVSAVDGGQANPQIPLQMGYTLYQRAANGSAVRVDPTKD